MASAVSSPQPRHLLIACTETRVGLEDGNEEINKYHNVVTFDEGFRKEVMYSLGDSTNKKTKSIWGGVQKKKSYT